MCLLAIYFQKMSDAPILMVAHRDEFYDRPATEPEIQSGDPPILCGLDARAGGTWLGVNRHGLTVAVTNRPKQQVPVLPRSRGLLCRELLAHRSAESAADLAARELASGNYDGANYLCVDREAGWFICGGDDVDRVPLSAGLHLLGNGNPDDPADPRQERARAALPEFQKMSTVDFLEQVTRAMMPPAQPHLGRSGIVLREANRGTVSSTALAVARDPAKAVYLYWPGPPDRTESIDCSQKLHQMLGA